jgi:hypothetical protein
MNERSRHADLRRREVRLEMGLFDLKYENYKRQSEVTMRTLIEIRETGESLKFGESLRVLDTLLAIPLRTRRATQRDQIMQVLVVLKEAFGVNSVGTVYDSWKNHQSEVSSK